MQESYMKKEWKRKMIKIKNVDAFEYIEEINKNSVDLIILDPNYQDWDSFLDRGLIEKSMEILKDSGNILCFTKQPFDYNLRVYINKWFRREIVWTFENGGAWCSPKMPLISTQKIYWITKTDNFFFNPRTGEDYNGNTKDFKRSIKVFEGFCEEGHNFIKSEEGTWIRDHLHYNKPNSGNIPAKPEKLIQIFLRCFCPENGTVLDLFSGSGIIPLICNRMNLNCYASELDSERCKNIEILLANTGAVKNPKSKELMEQISIFDYEEN